MIWPFNDLVTREDLDSTEHRLSILLQNIKQTQLTILMKVSEIPAFIQTVNTNLTTAQTAIVDQLDKAKGEIVQKIADLEAALSDVELPQEATDALNALKAATESMATSVKEKAQGLDDVVPDTTPTPPPTT